MHPSQKEVSSENRDNSTNGGTPSRNLAIIECNVPNNDPRGVSSEHVYIPTDDGIISRRRVTERTQRGNNAQRGVSLDRGYFALLENNTQGQFSSGNRDRSSGGGTDPPSRNYAVLPCTPPRSNAERGVSSGNRYTSYGGDTDSPSQRRVSSGNRYSSFGGESKSPYCNYAVSNSNSSGNRRKRPLVESSSDSENEMPYPEESMRAPQRSFKRNRSRFSSDFWLPRR